MKQSTKLLSLVLAIVMAFSCMSVIGSAAGTITTAQNMAYDSIDDALLTFFSLFISFFRLSFFVNARVFLYWRTKNMEVKLYETIN